MKRNILILVFLIIAMLITGCKDKVDNKAMDLKLTVNDITKVEVRSGIYTGEVDKDGLPDGQGKFTTKNPKGEEWSYEGSFKKGHFDGKGKFSGGYTYEGLYKNDMPNGEGKLTYADGRAIQGVFVNHHLTGNGKLLNKDGSVKYEGKFIKDIPVDIKPDFSGKAYDILGAFIEDEPKANAKYKNKILEVEGEVAQIINPTNKNEKGETITIKDRMLIILKPRFSQGRIFILRAVYTDKDLIASEEFQAIRNGQTIKFKGYFNGSWYRSEDNIVFVDFFNPIIMK